jgi:hypothetical protein
VWVWLLGIWGVANGGGIWIHLVCGDRLLGVRVAWATVNGLSGEVSSQKNFKQIVHFNLKITFFLLKCYHVQCT